MKGIWPWLGKIVIFLETVLGALAAIVGAVLWVLTVGIISTVVLAIWFLLLYCLVVDVFHWWSPAK